MKPNKSGSDMSLVTMQDMTTLFPHGYNNPSLNVDRWIKEGILLPKVTGHIRNALYPYDNIPRLHFLKDLGLLNPHNKPRYAGLRLTLWLKGFSLESKLIKEDVKEALMAVAKEGLANSNDLLVKDEKIANGLSKLFGVDKEAVRKSSLLNEDSLDQVVEEMASRLPPINEAEDRTGTAYVAGMENGKPQEVIRASHDQQATTFGDIEPQALIAMVRVALSLKFEDLIASLEVIETQNAFPLVGLLVASLLATFHPKPYVLPNANPKLVNVFIYVALTVLNLVFTLGEKTLGQGWVEGFIRYSLHDNWLVNGINMAGKDE